MFYNIYYYFVCITANTEVFKAKIFRLIRRCLLTEYVLFTSFILITLMHNVVRNFRMFLLHHPV